MLQIHESFSFGTQSPSDMDTGLEKFFTSRIQRPLAEVKNTLSVKKGTLGFDKQFLQIVIKNRD